MSLATGARDGAVATVAVTVAVGVAIGERVLVFCLVRTGAHLVRSHSRSAPVALYRLRRLATGHGSARARSRGPSWRSHLKRSAQLGLPWRHGRRTRVHTGGRDCRIRGGDADTHLHAVVEVVVARDQDVVLVVLEDETGAFIQAIEVLDRGNDGFGRVVRRNHDSHGQSCAILTVAVLSFGQDQLKRHLLLLSGAGRRPGLGGESGRRPDRRQHCATIRSGR